jgi:hypothetical protein
MLDFADYDGDDVTGAQFEDTKEEELSENIAMGLDEQREGEGVPRIDYDRDNPSLIEGSKFALMIDFMLGAFGFRRSSKTGFNSVSGV